MTRTTLAAAVVVAVVTIGSAFFVIQRGQPAITGPGPSASASASASQPAVVAPSATPTAEVSPSPVALGPKLAWTKVALDGPFSQVAWLGDHFVLIDQDSGAVRTSTDGVSWQLLQPGDPDPGYVELLMTRRGHPGGAFVSWEDQIVGWWNPEDGANIGGKPPITARDNLRIVRPPAPPTVTTPFKGRIESIGIGPKGIVAQVHSDLDWDAWVTKKLGLRTNNDWTCCVKDVTFENGVLQIKLSNGPGLKVVWADEGFLPGDYMYAGFGWFSPDGEQWTAIPNVPVESDIGLGFPTGFGDVVGVSDGFIARGVNPEDSCPLPGGCGEMWHSSDGLTWRNLGPAPESGGRVLPWLGGALVSDGIGHFDFWTSQGRTELPMATELPAAWKQQTSDEPHENAIGTGPLGAAMVSIDNHEILVTRDGVDWDIQPMPAEMAAAGEAKTVAVGERSVLVVSVSGTIFTPGIRTLWVGTPEP